MIRSVLNKKIVACFCAIGAAVLLAGCDARHAERPGDDRLPVIAGIPPLAFLVEQVGGQHVKVDALVQPGQDPHTFEPTPQQVVALNKAAVFFKIDMPFEAVLLEKAQEGNRRLKVIDATQGIAKRSVDVPPGEQAASEGHGEPDPHVWLSPRLAKRLAQNIAAGLEQADPAHAHDYQQNLRGLCERLDAVDHRMGAMLAPYRGRSFYVFHPGFGYFSDAYGLKQEAIEAEGRSPTPRQLHDLIEQARAEGAKAVFVQPQYAPQSAQVIADALGGRVVTINGLDKNLIADIEDIGEKITSTMKEARHGDEKTRK
jgi:zinc transport system substrate-binding protein